VDNSEKQVSALNIGKKSQMVLDYLEPLFAEQEQNSQRRMLSLYREGNYTESQLAGIAAELAALDTLRNKLKSQIKKGEKVAKEINDV
jgi:hypothetical protein